MSDRFHRRYPQRGFTLLELMIGCALGILVVAAAFAFAQMQTRQLSVTTERLYMTELGRGTLEVLTDDLRHAGAGVGYAEDGSFAGIFSGNFTLGTATFNSNNENVLNLEGGSGIPTDDIGLMIARAGYATLTQYDSGGTAEMCDGAKIANGDLVMLRSESGLYARSVIVSNLHSTICGDETCESGCLGFNWAADSLWVSDPSADAADYTGGEVEGGLSGVVWFLDGSDPSAPLRGNLRRAVIDSTHTCTARDSTCGELMAQNIETLQMQVWRFDTGSNAWVNVTGQPIATSDRVRVDVEVVLRGRAKDDRKHDAITLRLDPTVCLPTDCNPDYIERVALRTSVEIMNSSRMAIR